MPSRAPTHPAAFRLVGVLAICLFLLGTPRASKADQGELALGTGVALELPLAGGVDLGLEWGLGDWLSARGLLAGRADRDGELSGRAMVCAVAALDVLTWVPELALGAGADFSDEGARPVATLSIGLKRYSSFSWSHLLSLGGGVIEDRLFAFASLTTWFRVDSGG